MLVKLLLVCSPRHALGLCSRALANSQLLSNTQCMSYSHEEETASISATLTPSWSHDFTQSCCTGGKRITAWLIFTVWYNIVTLQRNWVKKWDGWGLVEELEMPCSARVHGMTVEHWVVYLVLVLLMGLIGLDDPSPRVRWSNGTLTSELRCDVNWT